MAKAEELAQLRDIHPPASIGWWPLAPGWYVLAIIATVALLIGFFFLRRHYVNGRARRQGLRLLSVYKQQYQREANSQLIAARISELLKRVALVYFPREKVASLQGESWIQFLNDTGKGVDFTTLKKELLEAPYHAMMDCDLHRLFDVTRTWIGQRRGPCSN